MTDPGPGAWSKQGNKGWWETRMCVCTHVGTHGARVHEHNVVLGKDDVVGAPVLLDGVLVLPLTNGS